MSDLDLKEIYINIALNSVASVALNLFQIVQKGNENVIALYSIQMVCLLFHWRLWAALTEERAKHVLHSYVT